MSIPLTPFGRREILLYGVGSFALMVALPVVAQVVGIYWLSTLSVLPAALLVFTLQFFRDPERTLPSEADALISPADGTVVDMVDVDEPDYIGGRARRVGIFMSPLNCHVNRFPVDGRVEKVIHRPGKFLKAYDPRAILENEASLTGILARLGGREVKLLMRQVSGVAARRIVNPLKAGDPARRGERFGMIKFGSRCEVFLPLDSGYEFSVKLGDAVYAGASILARPGKPAAAGATPVAAAAGAAS